MGCACGDQGDEPITRTSVDDQRKRSRPPSSGTASASPTATSRSKTQKSPSPAPSFRLGSLGQNARAVISAAVKPERDPAQALGEMRSAAHRLQSGVSRQGRRLRVSAARPWAGERYGDFTGVGPFPSSARFAASSRMATTPSKAAGLRSHDARPGTVEPVEQAARLSLPPGSPDQSSIPPVRGVKPRATSRCEKWRRSP